MARSYRLIGVSLRIPTAVLVVTQVVRKATEEAGEIVRAHAANLVLAFSHGNCPFLL